MSDTPHPDDVLDDDTFDPAPGVSADAEEQVHGDTDEVLHDARQEAEADAPVDYSESSVDQDQRVAEALAEATESPEAQAAGRLQAGQLLVLNAMGGGFTWGSALVRW